MKQITITMFNVYYIMYDMYINLTRKIKAIKIHTIISCIVHIPLSP